MSMQGIEMIRQYFKASSDMNWEAASKCIGPGYVWTDHATGVEARTPADLKKAMEDASSYSKARYDIEASFEATDGAVIIQGTQTCTIVGRWRSMDVPGKEVTFPFWSIFRFDDDGLIVHEEQYYDMHSVRQQLGY